METPAPAPRPRCVCEVDAADGTCLYRGTDLELACEIHDATPGAHLILGVAA